MQSTTHPRYTEQLKGHLQALQTLKILYENKKIHPCWLLYGPRGIGKATFAYQFAQYVLSKNDANPEGMPAPIVKSQILAGSYPNLSVLESLMDEEGIKAQAITIDQVRSLKNFLQQKPFISGWRLVIVDSVDELNHHGSNALLKILEEPPAQTLILLICHSLGRVLPTIRSRCQKIMMHPLKLENPMAQGSVGILNNIEALGGDIFIHQLSQLIEKSCQTNPLQAKPLAEELAKKMVSMDLIFLVLLQHIYHKVLMFDVHTEHWLRVWEKFSAFLVLAKTSHLDRLHTLMVCCFLINNPRLDTHV